MRIFVTGGSGFLGGRLLERLVRDGHAVEALARSDDAARKVEEKGARAVRSSLGAVPVEALRGMDAVIHSAALAGDYGARAAFVEANVEGTRQLLAAAREAGVPRFVHVSTEAVLFNGQDLVRVDETLPIPPRHRYAYGETKAASERLVLAADAPGFTTLALRPRLIWGPGDTTVLPVLLEMVEKGGFWWIDRGDHLTSTCHVDNAVEALVLALTRGRGGRAYFVTDGVDRPVRELLRALAATRGVTLPDRSLPGWLARPLAALVEGAWRLLGLGGRPPMTRMAIGMLSATVTVRDDAARQDLGYQPVIGVEAGLRALGAP